MSRAMPIEKQPKGSTKKPITPALSSRFRNGKTPIAPRLATSTPASPALIARKDLREQTLSPPSEQPSRLLNGNVTPRSGARSIRLTTESPQSPALARRLSGGSSLQGPSPPASSAVAVDGVGRALDQNRASVKSNGANTSAARRSSGSSTSLKGDGESSKFFRANDARPATTTVHHLKLAMSSRPLSTSDLNGNILRTVNSAPPSSIQTRDNEIEESFVRANEANIRATRPPLTNKKSTASITSMNTARTRSPGVSRTQARPQQQSPSAQTSPIRHTQAVTNKPSSPQKSTLRQSPTAPTPANRSSGRRTSLGSSSSTSRSVRPGYHKKSMSVNSLGSITPFAAPPNPPSQPQTDLPWAPPVISLPPQHSAGVASSPETLSPRSVSLASSKTLGTSVTSDTDASEISKIMLSTTNVNHFDGLAQPAQAPNPPTVQSQALTDAANARRERKVLDLEISNSSLLAINKTLEKELRKQSAELRRFRRLSRSGRLSIAPTHRSVSGQTTISLDTLQEQVEDERVCSDEDNDSEFDSLDEENDEDHSQEDDSSEDITARIRQRARDERRLLLDLEKHQQILIDSQKLNQSIRKCINITDDLIKDGKNALEYKVGIGDVKLGGRVLNADDYDHADGVNDGQQEGQGPRQGLLSPSINRTALEEASLWAFNIEEQPHTDDDVSPSLDPGWFERTNEREIDEQM